MAMGLEDEGGRSGLNKWRHAILAGLETSAIRAQLADAMLRRTMPQKMFFFRKRATLGAISRRYLGRSLLSPS